MTTTPTGPIEPEGRARLLQKSEKTVPTSVQLCDARSALVRGLSEYIETLSWQAVGGREVKFKRVTQEWAEVEEKAKWPSLAVYTIAPGAYDSSGFTPQVNPECQLPPPDGRYIISPATMVVDLVAELWATDPRERSQLVLMLETFLNPVLYRYGFQLALPYYGGQIASYALEEVTFEDAEDEAHRRIRKAMFSLNATLPVVQLISLPLAKPRFELRDIGTGGDVLVQFVVE